MYEGQINAKPTVHLTQVDNQVMDKTSRESKLKSDTLEISDVPNNYPGFPLFSLWES